jgi:methylated-DNA-[protein]-cysteine S-methyltransferase
MRLETPFGPVWAAVNESGALTALGFGEPKQEGGFSAALAQQLAEYFDGKRGRFELPLAPAGSDFQKQVWAQLQLIPLGESISYAELARRVGRPGAARAVGRANATNPIALIVPCHRVIGSGGKLTGYAYGVDLKDKLLAWERHTRTALAPSAPMPSKD